MAESDNFLKKIKEIFLLCFGRRNRSTPQEIIPLIAITELNLVQPTNQNKIFKNPLDEILGTEEIFCNNMGDLIEAIKIVRVEEKSRTIKKAFLELSTMVDNNELSCLSANLFKHLDKNKMGESKFIDALLAVITSKDFEKRLSVIEKVTECLNKLNNTSELQSEYRKSNLQYNSLAIYTNPQSGLHSLLTQPMQRVVKYKLLCEELSKQAKDMGIKNITTLKKLELISATCRGYAARLNRSMPCNTQSSGEAVPFLNSTRQSNKNNIGGYSLLSGDKPT